MASDSHRGIRSYLSPGRWRRRWSGLTSALLLLAMACSRGGSAPTASTSAGESAPSGAPRTLNVAIQVEPQALASRALIERGVNIHTTKRTFNADLVLFDDRGLPQPYLAEALPKLNTDSWKVEPDGKMETTYRLRPNLTWHDGAPLTADDFVFSFDVYSTAALGLSTLPPFDAMDEVVPQDDRTILIRWRRPYPDADQLAQYSFPPLPRHILGQPFEQDSTEAFANNMYWTREFVGLGPFRLTHWEPGAFIDAEVFPGHALGKPGIDRMHITFIGDPNAALANVMTGTVQMAADGALDFRAAVTLKRDWAPRKAGDVLFHPNQWNSVRFQLRSDIVTPRSLLDVRVRQALAHAIDKNSLNDALFDGEGVIAETMIAPHTEYSDAVDKAITHYPYDLQRSEQLMTQAGFTKGADGFYTNEEGRFRPETKYFDPPALAAEGVAIASGWRTAGFDVQEAVFPFAQAQDNQARATFSGMFNFQTQVGEPALIGQTTGGIPRSDNRWTGGNRGGWSDPEYDRIVDAFISTLDRAERTRQVVQLTKIYSDQLPGISLWYPTQPLAFSSAVRGPVLAASNSLIAWNMYQWELSGN